jgi:hypothetical protein
MVFAKTVTIEASGAESNQVWWDWGHKLAVKSSRGQQPAVNVNGSPCFELCGLASSFTVAVTAKFLMYPSCFDTFLITY